MTKVHILSKSFQNHHRKDGALKSSVKYQIRVATEHVDQHFNVLDKEIV